MLSYIRAESFTGFFYHVKGKMRSFAQYKIALHLTVYINIYVRIFVIIEHIDKMMKSDVYFILCFNKQ